jgi:hypothetical protein
MSDDAFKMLDSFESKMLPPASPKFSVLPASKDTVVVTRQDINGTKKYL